MAKLILLLKEVRSIISYHESNLPKTLVDLFPDIGLDASKFENRKSMLLAFKKIIIHINVIL